jgi:hypothetical protein
VTEDSTRNNFSQFASTTMGKTYGFFTNFMLKMDFFTVFEEILLVFELLCEILKKCPQKLLFYVIYFKNFQLLQPDFIKYGKN